MEIIRGRLAAKDVSNPSLRYNPDTDQVQFSPDNGATWVDMPSLDPRHSSAFLLPPLTGDARCDAAANMVKWMKDFLDGATELLCAGSTALAVANTAIPLYELISGGSLTLLAIITEVAGGLFSLGCTALTAAFDSTAYDALLCAFFCHIGGDGQVTADQLAAIETQVTADLNTTAGIVVNAILALQGEVGLSNAGVIGAQTGVCDDCACAWCYNFQSGSRLDEWIPHDWFGTEAPATWTGTRWEATGTTTTSVWLSWTFSTPITLTDGALITYYRGGGNATIFVNGDGSGPFTATEIWANGAIIGSPFPLSVSRIDVCVVRAFSTETLWLSEMQFSGSDLVNPFGADNC